MYAFLPSTASRAEPVEWTRLVSAALAVVQLQPAETVLNALAMLSSYAAASPSVFASLTRGVRETREYVALLLALDDAVGAWPLRMRQLLTVPPVCLVAAGAGLNGSLMTVPVRTPRGEALVFLLNVALDHVERGLGYLARVHADTASAHSACTPQGGSVAVPNQNAKTAAQHLRQAVEALRWTDAIHAAPASPSAVVLQQLHAQLPLDAVREMAALCGAVAKYMYALSSASTKDKPDVLAKLVFEAAQLPLPASVQSGSSLQLLPSLLLAAYHYHQATWYYAHAASNGPEMAEALGHARYADSLLHTCNAQWTVESGHQEATHESQQWWGRRLASLFTSRGSSGKKKKTESPDDASGGVSLAPSRLAALTRGFAGLHDLKDDNDNNDNDDEEHDTTSGAAFEAATRYPSLHALLHGRPLGGPKDATATAAPTTTATAPADVVQVYPYARLLLNDVCAALQQYEKENRVVYFAKVATADDVRRDVPDVAQQSTSGPAKVSRADAEDTPFESRSALFAALPSSASLQAALAKQEEVGQTQQALSRALQRVEQTGRQLAAYVTPTAAIEQAVDALEALTTAAAGPAEWAKPEAVIVCAVDVVNAATVKLSEAGAEWQEDHDAYVGESRAPPAIVEALMRETTAWTKQVEAALNRWRALGVPATVDSRAAFLASLVPRSDEMRMYLEQVGVLSRDVRDVLAAEAGSVTLAQVQSALAAVEKVKQRGTELLAGVMVDRRATRHRGGSAAAPDGVDGDDADVLAAAPQYEQAESVVLEMAEALQAAPLLVARMEAAVEELREMQRRAVITPINRLHNVQFRSATPSDSGVKPPAGRGVKAQESATAASGSARAAGDVAAAPPAPSGSPQSTRKRARSESEPSSTTPPPPVGSANKTANQEEDDDDNASVHSSQLGDAEEVAPAPEDGATQASVSRGLLSRMRANKARRLTADAPPAPAPKAKAARTETTRGKR